MVRRIKTALRWALPALVLVLAMGYAVLAWWPATPELDLPRLHAQARWDNRPFDRYEMVISEETRAGICRQEVQVANEQVSSVLRNLCRRPPNWTVTRLFSWLDQLKRSTPNCYPSVRECACVSFATTQVSYDSRFGYPETIVYAWELQPNWRDLSYWRFRWWDRSMPNCDVRRAFGGTMTVKVNITPIP